MTENATPTPAETTGAIQRAGRAIWEHDNGHTTWPPADPLEIGPAEDAGRAALAAALDVDEMARAAYERDNPTRPTWEQIPRDEKALWLRVARDIRAHLLGTGVGA